MRGAFAVVVVFLAIIISLFVGTAVVDQFTTSQDTFEDLDTAVPLAGTGEFVDLDGDTGDDDQVVDSRGFGIVLENGSSFATSSSVDLADDRNWTVSAWGNVSTGHGSDRQTLLDVNGQLTIIYDGPNSQWQAWYYDESATDSYLVNVSAPNQPGNLSNVQVTANGTALQIEANNTVGETADLTTSNHADANLTTADWNGTVDEVRVFDTALNSSDRAAIYTDPVGPLPDRNRTLRVMFDEPNRDTQRAFFAPTDITTTGEEYEQALDGQALVEGTDYEWKTRGPEIRPLAGGEVDGAPVVYVDYDKRGTLARSLSSWTDFVAIAVLLGVIGLVTVIMTRLRSV